MKNIRRPYGDDLTGLILNLIEMGGALTKSSITESISSRFTLKATNSAIESLIMSQKIVVTADKFTRSCKMTHSVKTRVWDAGLFA